MLLNWQPPGPVSAAFLADRSPVSAIMGPVGSAKTSTCVMKLLNIAAEQKRSVLDGKRYSKFMVVRDTYRNLSRTTIPTFKSWLRGGGHWTGGGSEPATLRLGARLQDQSVMEAIFEFVALGDQSIEDVARGWEGTGFYLNEADLQPPEVFTYLMGRVGRYPSAIHGGPSWAGGILDYNAPDTENYCYSIFEEIKPEGYTLFKQPGGRTAQAENTANLPPDYYDKQVQAYLAAGRDDLVRRMVDNNYGYSRDGKPVYPEYRDDFHCAGVDLEAVEGLPIRISADQGLHPAAVLSQTMPNGQKRILEELYCDTGAQGLAEMVLRMMGQRYPGFRLVGGECDLAGEARSGNDVESWLDAFNRFLNLRGRDRIRASSTNKPDKCTAALRMHLTGLVDQGLPRVLISGRCKVMRKGLNSEYCYKKMKSSNGFDDKPVKKFPVSDVMNALEFECLSGGGYEEVVGRDQRAKGWGRGGMFQARTEVPL